MWAWPTFPLDMISIRSYVQEPFLAILWRPHFCQFWQFVLEFQILCSGGIKLPILAILWSPFLANFGNFVFHPNPNSNPNPNPNPNPKIAIFGKKGDLKIAEIGN